MVRVSVWAAMTMLVVAIGLARPAAAQPPKVLRLGVVAGMFRDVPPSLVQIAATPFREVLKRQTGCEGDVEVFADHEELAAKLQAGKAHLGVFHGFEWAWVKDRHPDLIPMAVTVPQRKPQAVIVVKADSTATPADLKGACVAVPLATKAHCFLFLERLADTLPAGCCGAKPAPDAGPNEVMEQVVDGRVPAALLDVAALKAYQDDRPGRGKMLKELVQSEPFPQTVVVYRKDAVSPEMAGKIQAGLLQTKNESSGRAFLFMWKLKGFDAPPPGYDAELVAVAKRYPPPRPAMGTMMAMPE